MRMLVAAALLGAAFGAAASAAQSPAAAPAGAAQPTIQQQFETRSTALENGRWEQALALYQALEARLPAKRTRDVAIVRVREAQALAQLGREDEARQVLRLGLPTLPAADPSLAGDRFIGLVILGKI